MNLAGIHSALPRIATRAALASSLAFGGASASLASDAPASNPAIASAPPGLGFYQPPSPLPPGQHGDVIWSRPLSGPAAIRNAAETRLVLYHTTSVLGVDTAVSGSVAIPPGAPPAGGWPVVSWAHGTTGNAPQCAPTRFGDADFEQTYMGAWVARGYAVVQTDYEGQGVPGLHPYFVGVAAGRDTTDIVRAARLLYPQIGKKWFVLGHSEGGNATVFTAGVGPAWAPELHLEGAVAFAPGSHISGMIAHIGEMTRPVRGLPFILQMIEGIASTDPAIDLRSLMTPDAYARLPELQKTCTDILMDDNQYLSMPPAEIFRPGADTKPLQHDFLENEASLVHSDVPVLILQGSDDDLVSPVTTGLLRTELCRNGTRVNYTVVGGKTHDSIVTDTLPQTERWVDAVAAGTPPSTDCT